MKLSLLRATLVLSLLLPLAVAGGAVQQGAAAPIPGSRRGDEAGATRLEPSLVTSSATSGPAGTVPAWSPDQGDGTYKNPVLYADYSDPDVVRVGDDFYLVSSSFSHAPGLPVLHSRDLVNWTLLNHALPTLGYVEGAADHFAVPHPGEGVWAPAIRFHGGRFYVYYPDPDFGIYVVTATDPAGAWSAPVLVQGGKGLIDPCPLWDEDGQVYLIHGWAKSRSGINNLLTLNKLSPDGLKVVDEGKIIIDANKLPGWTTLEGPKIYRRGGYYYVFAPAGGVTGGYQAVFRAKDIYGPYENRIVLDQGETAVNGPHQGAWVDTASGENWFLHFQDRGPSGRVVHLEPMAWRADGWPAMGTAVASGAEKGEPVSTYRKPVMTAATTAAITVPATSDDFTGPRLGLQWQWQANPRPDYFSLTANPGSLRLASIAAPVANSLWLAPNLLLQKFPAPGFTVTTALKFFPASPDESAGLIVFGYDYAWAGLRRTPMGLRVSLTVCHEASKAGVQREAAGAYVPSNGILLRVSVDADAHCRFSYSTDGRSFTPLGEPFQATGSRWVGAKVGLFASARAGTDETGHADFDWFRVTP